MYDVANHLPNPEVQMRSHHNVASLTSELITAAKLLPPADFWRLAAVVTRTLRETEASPESREDDVCEIKSGH